MRRRAEQASLLSEEEARIAHLDVLIRSIQDEVHAVAAAEAETEMRRRARNGAVRMALGAGYSHAVIAARLGVPPGRVEEMAAAAGPETGGGEAADAAPEGDRGATG